VRRAPLVYRVLLRLWYPADVVERHGREIEEALVACVVRERARLGLLGAVYAWIRALGDLFLTAILTRLDARRTRRIAALHPLVDSTGDDPMSNLGQDLRYSFRMIRRAPLSSAIVVLTLALAIGANTAIFGVVDAVLLRPLPYHDPARLVMVYEAISKTPAGFSAPDYLAFEERAAAFESIAAFRNKEFELSGVDQPDRVMGAVVSTSLFRTLGVAPALGRDFVAEDDRQRRAVVVLSHSLWWRAFAGDPNAVGRTLMLERVPYTVVGVMPKGFTFPNRGPVINQTPAALYVPIAFSQRERRAFGSMYNNSVVARLKPDVSVTQADSEVRSIVSRFVAEIYPPVLAGLPISGSAAPLREETVGQVSTLLFVIFGAGMVVLLIASADIASLMLTRAAGRQREMAVRAAVGASRMRLIRQALVESTLLALCGGAAGLGLTSWAISTVVALAPPTIPRLQEVGLDWRVAGFSLAMSLLTALMCGVLPALELSRHDSSETLKEGGRSGSGGRRQRRIFAGLVTAQIALAVVLLVAGGLFVRSFARLIAVDPGFRAESVLTVPTSLPLSAYSRGSDIRAFYSRLLERIEALPGVMAAGASTFLPMSVLERRVFTIEAPPAASRDLPHTIANDWIAGRFFEAFGIPLKSGRYIAPEDASAAEPVVVINETMARHYWPGQDPVGQRIAWGLPNDHGRWMRIVGIVGDVKQGPLNTATVPQSYTIWAQTSDAFLTENVLGLFRSLNVVVRTENEPGAIATAVRSHIRELDPSLPLTAVQTMEEVVQKSTTPQRFNTVLIGSFASIALLLAALGIGGVLATSVSRRTQEIGIRMALGAERSDVVRMILRQGLTIAAAGLLLGLAASLLVTRVMSSLLFEIGPRDPITFAGVMALLALVALVACYLPARRATRIEPVVALRHE
jgi:putative ABC transport system permease protein